MGVRAHVQVKQPEYGSCRLSSWAQGKAAAYLNESGINIFTGNDYDVVDYADHWEIEIPWNRDGIDYAKIESVIADLRAHPEKVSVDEEYKHGNELASLLEEGLEAAKANGYNCICIDWF